MKLPHPFYRLPISLDVQRLQEEVAALPEAAWHAHPTGYKGNASVRLISADGGENDDMIGDMQPTQWLDQMPYVRQILSQLGLVWSRGFSTAKYEVDRQRIANDKNQPLAL